MCASDLRRITLTALGLLIAGTAFAQSANSREQEQLRRLRQQVQQLQQQQSTDQETARKASADASAAKTQLADAQGELKRLRAQHGNQAGALAQAQKEQEALRQEQTALQARLNALQAELDSSRQAAERQRGQIIEWQSQQARERAAAADLLARHQTQAQGLQLCVANNQALRKLGDELLQRYIAKGHAEVAAQNEIFVQTRRVALENLVQDYEDKLDRLVLKPLAATEAPRAP